MNRSDLHGVRTPGGATLKPVRVGRGQLTASRVMGRSCSIGLSPTFGLSPVYDEDGQFWFCSAMSGRCQADVGLLDGIEANTPSRRLVPRKCPEMDAQSRIFEKPSFARKNLMASEAKLLRR